MNYDMIDRFLRYILDDDDYAEYSAALDARCLPQRKPWDGLTDEEFVELCSADLGTAALIRAVEAKLKEKNT
jgi:hypothetical protein